MVHATPDLASFDSSAEIPCTMRAPGPGRMKTGQAVQSSDSSPAPSPPKARPIPPNFVWRLGGGRRSSSSTTEAEIEERDMAVAVDVPALRVSFDPWGQQQQREEENERCKGCTKISKARAAAAVTAVMPAKAAGSPPVPKPHGQYIEFHMSSMSGERVKPFADPHNSHQRGRGGTPSFMPLAGQSMTEPPTPFCNPPVIPLLSLPSAFSRPFQLATMKSSSALKFPS